MPDESDSTPVAVTAPAARPRVDAPPTPAGTRQAPQSREIGGPKGPEPTRFGDWERAGRCIDF
ncbi:MAG TPA: DUF1674 domain-containing protein [Gammaproteobacteria bacterium]|nr:DUF1674 domain-containing protein [Gammaproteobacteria bacterium]